jgi:hypothetical protein
MTEPGKLYVFTRPVTVFLKNTDVDDGGGEGIMRTTMHVKYNPGDTFVVLEFSTEFGETQATCLGYDGYVFCLWDDSRESFGNSSNSPFARELK